MFPSTVSATTELLWRTLVVLLAHQSATRVFTTAYKDDSYYPKGVTNPNTKNAMYWRDARNVLQDISQFQSLSIKYHSCAWSGVAVSNQGGSGDKNGADNLCQTIDYGEGDDENNAYDWWYLGSTVCNRANAAFSLYGTLAGKEEKGCRKSSYINSFFTNQGLGPFMQAMTNAGVSYFQTDDNTNSLSSYCTIIEGATDDNYSGGDDTYEKYAYGNHNEGYFDNFYSQSLACNRGRFVQQNFQGAFCNAEQVTKIVDSMNQVNSALNSLDCVQIYNADSDENSNGDNNDKDEDEDYDGALQLLQYSEACSLRDPSGACPDPFGKLQKYSNTIERISRALDMTSHRRKMRRNISLLMIVMGVAFFLLAFRVFLRRVLKRFPALRKRLRGGSFFRSMKRRSRRKSEGDGIHKAIDSDRNSRKKSSRRQRDPRPAQDYEGDNRNDTSSSQHELPSLT
jgi:hypothetical protein